MKDNTNELFAEIDENGTPIGKITRHEAHNNPNKPLHAVVHLHLFNSAGDLFLQHRPAWKDIQPDKWDTACGGHIDYGETVEQALRREVREELGITNLDWVVFLGKYIFESARERELVYVHKLIYDGKVVPSKDELNGGRFFPIDEIHSRLHTNFFTPNFESEYSKFF